MKERVNALRALGWQGWVYALLHSVVGGVATTLAAAITIVGFRTSHSWQDIGSLALASAFINLLLYLKQSPIPAPFEQDEPSTSTHEQA